MFFSTKAQKCWIPGLVSQVVYLFPIAAVINCHKPGDLTQVYWYYLIALDIRSLKSVSLRFSQMSWGLVPSGSFRREYVSLLFSAFPGCLHSLPPGPFLISLQLLVSMVTTPTTDSGPPASFLYGHLGLHWAQPENPGQFVHLKIFHHIFKVPFAL